MNNLRALKNNGCNHQAVRASLDRQKHNWTSRDHDVVCRHAHVIAKGATVVVFFSDIHRNEPNLCGTCVQASHGPAALAGVTEQLRLNHTTLDRTALPDRISGTLHDATPTVLVCVRLFCALALYKKPVVNNGGVYASRDHG